MYDVAPAATDAFWTDLARHLRAAGIAGVPDRPARPGDLDSHWLAPDLLLSQTCGYPFATRLAGRVRLVGAFRYGAEGSEGIAYRSALMVRDDDPARALDDLRGRPAAINSVDSHSGCTALLHTLAPFARDGRMLDRLVETGSHRASLAAIREKRADVAAIDCVTLALVRRHAAGEAEGLRVLAWSAAAPGLPLVTAGGTADDDLARLRAGLEAAIADPTLAAARAELLIEGFEPVDADIYGRCLLMREEAAPAAI
jgi:ABC-type phosphate/phosphonate transport system substrate-binding protein